MRKATMWIFGALGALLIAAAPATGADFYGTLKKIQDSGVIRIGFRDSSPPFSFLGSDGRPAGYSIDLCRHVAAAVKSELKLADLKIEFIPVTSANRIAKVADGEIDIECGSTSHTLQRRKQVDFSYFIFLTGTRILVKKDAAIHDYKDLGGKSVAVTAGTTNQDRIQAMANLLNIETKIVTVADHDKGFAAVADGTADAFATDDILLRGLVQRSATPDAFAVVGNFLSYDPYALMIRRDDSAFRLVVDRTLADLFFRRQFEALFDKWFEPMGIPMTDMLRAAMTIQMHVN